MLQFIFRTTLLVSIVAALLAVEFNSFHKAMTVKPVQVFSVAVAKKVPQVLSRDQAL